MWFRLAALIVTLALGLLATPVPVEPQTAGKGYRIGILSADPAWAYYVWLRLPALTYGAERRNIASERRVTDKNERLPELAADLVRLKVDAIVAAGTPAIRAAKEATTTIPIVMVAHGNPVSAGLVASLARPGGNVTGVTTLVPELVGKRLELLKETVPGLTRVAVLRDPTDPDGEEQWRETQLAARALRVELRTLDVRRRADLASAFAAAIKEEAGALIVLADSLTTRHANAITNLAAKHGLPAIYPYDWFARGGLVARGGETASDGLMSYGPVMYEVSRRVAVYVDEILKGANPADLPVEQPRNLELVINMKAARALRLTIPPSVLIRADEVVE